ncbi:hypothetical protein HZB69_04490 [Candidatus Amesbacteria bacterium]|nr:hypothetical protein [Candidatus Amesbacteria bacterium]
MSNAIQALKGLKTNLYIDGTNLFVGLVDLFGLKNLPKFSSILKEINKIIKVDQIFFYASYTPPSNKKYKFLWEFRTGSIVHLF